MPGQSERTGAEPSPLLSGYRPPPGVADELLQPDGSLRAVWQPLIDLLSRQSPEDLQRRFATGDQYLHDAGVYFRQHTDAGWHERDWPLSHIPILIDEAEWAGISAGIIQRAELLEQLMADIYGPGEIVRRGLLPPSLVARNPEWLRPMVGSAPRGGHFLHHLAFEIGRSPDGSWFVLGDRTQAPSGAGFALENRVATSRIFADHFPKANVERLAGFFRGFRDALNGLRGEQDGRVAILTPGPATDTYFEHAYIARYLGFMLLQSDDIKVDRGRLFVRTVTGPEPLDVIWRRLDARFADPLELDEHSMLGIPGLCGAARGGAVTLINALGSGMLEARALLAFLPRICRELTGADLKLPNIATWWCGQDSERRYVHDNMTRMMIGPALSTRLPFEIDGNTVLGGAMRAGAEDAVAGWLDADGTNLVGQEAVTLSTTPAMIGGRLVPRPMTVRVFAARSDAGWTVMPGGYARIGQTEDPTALAMQSGGSVADVWIIRRDHVSPDTLTGQPEGPFVRREPGVLPARAADDLFWLGRYVERAEARVRKLRAYHLRLAESGDPGHPLLTHLADFLAETGTDVTDPVPVGLLSLLDGAQGCAARVRDRFSTDGWLALSDLSRTARNMAETAMPGDDAARSMSVLLRKLAGFSGLVHENMFRFTGWRFLTIGRALERADRMAHVLAGFADPDGPVGGYDLAVEVGDSVMTHRRRYAVETNRNTVIDLLALDGRNPRSVRYQLDALRRENALLPKAEVNGQLSEVSRIVLQLQTDLATMAPADLDTARLSELRAGIAEISDGLTSLYLI